MSLLLCWECRRLLRHGRAGRPRLPPPYRPHGDGEGDGRDLPAELERLLADDGDDDGVVFGGVTPGPLDKAGVAAFHEQFMAAFPSTEAELVELVETGDRLAARLLPHVRHEGPFMGVEPTGREAVLAITTLLRMRDGQCVERWSTADMLGLMMQLGAIGAPGG